jgi:hypothetical protein
MTELREASDDLMRFSRLAAEFGRADEARKALDG